jgi:hypothetical protein
MPTKLNTMEKQLNLFDNVNEATNPACFLGAVMRSAFVDDNKVIRTEKWQEFHKNGQLWIDGEIAIVSEDNKDLYDYRTGFAGYEGKPVCRIGIWTKYFDNGQLAWQIDYGDGSYETLFSGKRKGQQFPSYRKDGTPIRQY